MIPACLNAIERSRRLNIFPIILGPHDSNLEDSIDALHGLRLLDRGVKLTIDGESQHVSTLKILVCSRLESIAVVFKTS